MTTSSKCWWRCQNCTHTMWRGIVTGSALPCPKCGGENVRPWGGAKYLEAVRFMERIDAERKDRLR